ncbi:beta-ketoacyl-[acyl-carrier-protein] synthase family protein [Methylobacillus gramineus]|uniref:beta-ketoacyl-[acyl-carrier-protein] synthase family protein n=1 Tax=Methylobacillus gramineus TaxID=755169 RepID=UPI001CFFC424|nr:beta-ketoacyl-[acyl-carrier-protein] synthase family protein [Methylobacillus gramineus]MCB5183726.1 beta-ketoacyl-[acyl-carrier-protein] synthase family protein [Methylobacillus gramineus]
MSQRYYLSALGIINALGYGKHAIMQGLFQGDTSGMTLEQGWLHEGTARVGRTRGELPQIPSHLADFSSRNNQLLLAAMLEIEAEIAAAIAHFGPARIGVVIGSSTSGMAEGEAAVMAQQTNGHLPEGYQYLQQELGTPALFASRYLKLSGPAYTVSTACTSSAKAFQSARNLLKHGICDAVLVGGVDTLCKLTINGFTALESTSAALCQPMSLNRQGINIGEGAAFFILSKQASSIELLGIGESSDAYHMSAPEPEGRGAESAMRAALTDASLKPEAIGYLNLHATATRKNDEMESHAVARVFPAGVPCSGTKPLTGHTLGAAGATELAFCWLALQHQQLPPHIWDGIVDDTLSPLTFTEQDQAFSGHGRRCMSNSFAFGGSNTSLIIGDAIT